MLILGETEPERNWWRGPSTTTASGPTSRFWRSTAPLPEALIESELFGHETLVRLPVPTGNASASSNSAAIGTVFLDEIGDMPLDGARPKVLALLQRPDRARRKRGRRSNAMSASSRLANRNWASESPPVSSGADLFDRLQGVTDRTSPLPV